MYMKRVEPAYASFIPTEELQQINSARQIVGYKTMTTMGLPQALDLPSNQPCCRTFGALSFGIKGVNNTYSRFKQLAIADPRNEEIYINCAEAFLTLSKFRTIEGLKNEDSGQYINLNELNKLDKERLKNALAPMRELEELIKDKFQLTQFS